MNAQKPEVPVLLASLTNHTGPNVLDMSISYEVHENCGGYFFAHVQRHATRQVPWDVYVAAAHGKTIDSHLQAFTT